MSVKGRTYPYQVVYQYPNQDKPGTTVIHRDRDNAESSAVDIQRCGGSAQVVLVQDKVRIVVTERPEVAVDLLTEPEAPTYTVVTMRASGFVHHRNTAEEAHRKAVDIQRAGYAAEIRRAGIVVSAYPALTGDALVRTQEPTVDERTGQTPIVITESEQHERELDVQRLVALETEGPLSRQLRALAEAEEEPDDSCTSGPEHKYELLYEDDDVRQYACKAPGCGAETYEDKAKSGESAPSPIRVEFNAEWDGGNASETVEFDRAEWDRMTVDQRRNMLDDAAADFMSSSGASYGYTVLGDDAAEVEKPEPGVPDPAVDDWARSEHRKALAVGERRRADFERTVKRAAGDAADALGGKLGQALGDLLGYIAGAEAFTPAGLTGEVERLAELVTERALAHREFSRGGPDRRDIDKAARDAYSERFEPSPKLRRDHDAALVDVVDAVFDAVAWGQRKVLMNPNYGLRQVAIRARDGQYDDGYPWTVSNGGYYRDRDVEGWWEMAPTGRVFKPEGSDR